jgi:uncharacterized membrane protein YcaP (DUF421 family)
VPDSPLIQVFTAKGSDLGPLLIIPRTAIVFLMAIVYARLAKKRFIAQASAADLVMAIIFGSVLSRAINGGADLATSLVAGIVLVFLQRLLAHFSCLSKPFAELVKGTTEVLIRDGVAIPEKMRKHDISEEDLQSELRINGLTNDVSEVALGTLERSGRVSVVKKS